MMWNTFLYAGVGRSLCVMCIILLRIVLPKFDYSSVSLYMV